MTKLYNICDAALMCTFKAFGDFKVSSFGGADWSDMKQLLIN